MSPPATTPRCRPRLRRRAAAPRPHECPSPSPEEAIQNQLAGHRHSRQLPRLHQLPASLPRPRQLVTRCERLSQVASRAARCPPIGRRASASERCRQAKMLPRVQVLRRESPAPYLLSVASDSGVALLWTMGGWQLVCYARGWRRYSGTHCISSSLGPPAVSFRPLPTLRRSRCPHSVGRAPQAWLCGLAALGLRGVRFGGNAPSCRRRWVPTSSAAGCRPSVQASTIVSRATSHRTTALQGGREGHETRGTEITKDERPARPDAASRADGALGESKSSLSWFVRAAFTWFSQYNVYSSRQPLSSPETRGGGILHVRGPRKHRAG